MELYLKSRQCVIDYCGLLGAHIVSLVNANDGRLSDTNRQQIDDSLKEIEKLRGINNDIKVQTNQMYNELLYLLNDSRIDIRCHFNFEHGIFVSLRKRLKIEEGAHRYNDEMKNGLRKRDFMSDITLYNELESMIHKAIDKFCYAIF